MASHGENYPFSNLEQTPSGDRQDNLAEAPEQSGHQDNRAETAGQGSHLDNRAETAEQGSHQDNPAETTDKVDRQDYPAKTTSEATSLDCSPSAASADCSHPIERVNFFRLCRIVLDSTAEVLRSLFKKHMSQKYDKLKWSAKIDCTAKVKMSKHERDFIKKKNVNEWDTSFLGKILLYSNHFLLVDVYSPASINQEHYESTKNKNYAIHELVCKENSSMFKNGSIILIDAPNVKDLLKTEISNVKSESISLKDSVVVANIKNEVTVYQCSQEWHAVARLYEIRNDCFGHVKSAQIDSERFGQVVNDVQACYYALQVSSDSLKKIMLEPYNSEECDKMPAKWYKEMVCYVQSMEGIHSDVTKLRHEIKAYEEELERVRMKTLELDTRVERNESTQRREMADLNERVDRIEGTQKREMAQLNDRYDRNESTRKREMADIKDQMGDFARKFDILEGINKRKEADAVQSQSARVASVSHIMVKIEVIEDQLSNLANALLMCLNKKKVEVQEVTSWISSLPPTVNIYVFNLWSKICNQIHECKTLLSLFTILNKEIWNILDYNLLEYLIKKSGDKKLKEDMVQYINTLKDFKQTTYVVDFIEYWKGRCHKFPYFSNFQIKFEHDKSKITLEILDDYRENITADIFPSLREFSGWMFHHNFEDGCFIVSWRLPEQLACLIRVHIRSSHNLLIKYGVIEVIVEDKVVYNKRTSSYRDRLYSLPNITALLKTPTVAVSKTTVPPVKKAKLEASASTTSSSVDYSKMGVADLKKELLSKGLKTTGKKTDLVERLQAVDSGSKGKVNQPKEEDQEQTDLSKAKRAFAAETESKKKNKAGKKQREVDPHVPDADSKEVYEDWDCMLNQTNIGHNKNKFYVIQLLKTGPWYNLWTRWGRVGETGQHAMGSAGDLETVKKEFMKKFLDKTNNKWENRDNFQPVPKKYTLLEMDNDSEDDEMKEKLAALDETDAGPTPTVLPCTLDTPTQALIKLIFNTDMFMNALKGLKIDTKEMPLGKLSESQIAKGLEALKNIEKAIDASRWSSLEDLTSKFYTIIPHDFGHCVPRVIMDKYTLQKKFDMLLNQLLGDTKMAQGMQAEDKVKTKVVIEVPHELDVRYKTLNCDLTHVDPKSHEYDVISKFVMENIGILYTPKIVDFWRVKRHKVDDSFKAHDAITNHSLWLHVTEVAAVAAILKSGLRIKSHSDGRVGKGICLTFGNIQCTADNIGIVFLYEVLPGEKHHITMEDWKVTAPPSGFDSIIVEGRSKSVMKMGGKDVSVPQGKPITASVKTTSNFWQSDYLFYRECQTRIRYMLKMQF